MLKANVTFLSTLSNKYLKSFYIIFSLSRYYQKASLFLAIFFTCLSVTGCSLAVKSEITTTNKEERIPLAPTFSVNASLQDTQLLIHSNKINHTQISDKEIKAETWYWCDYKYQEELLFCDTDKRAGCDIVMFLEPFQILAEGIHAAKKSDIFIFGGPFGSLLALLPTITTNVGGRAAQYSGPTIVEEKVVRTRIQDTSEPYTTEIQVQGPGGKTFNARTNRSGKALVPLQPFAEEAMKMSGSDEVELSVTFEGASTSVKVPFDTFIRVAAQ
ncbi:MAG: hypothetical protein HUU50_02445 [Candidatus Brocadiae bacterium]|nr:hypothetical protein [Candidatus Brocadiia bacterium]